VSSALAGRKHNNRNNSQTLDSTHWETQIQSMKPKTASNHTEKHATPNRRCSSRQKRKGSGRRTNVTNKRKAASCRQQVTARKTGTSHQPRKSVEIPHLKVFISDQLLDEISSDDKRTRGLAIDARRNKAITQRIHTMEGRHSTNRNCFRLYGSR
jgi:hypothetical protein